jgi:MFS family permease
MRHALLDGPWRLRDRWIAHLRASGVHQRWILFSGLAGMFAGGFTFTVLAVSLKNIAAELGSTETTLSWVVTAPILFSAIALPLLGKFGDMYGHRRVFLLGSTAATLLSFVTAGAWDAYSLIGLRVAASITGAASGPSSMALIFTAYSGKERTRAMGWWSMMGAGAPALGLIAGGPMVQYMGWRMLFIVQGVFSVLALALAWFVLVETTRLKVRLDVLGSVLLAMSAGCLMFALSQVGELGPSSPWIWGAILLGVAFVYGFVRVEAKTEQPLLPLRFFSYRNFTAPILSGALQNGAYMGAFVLAPFLLQNVFELTLVATSLFMLLRTLTLTLTSPLGGVLGTRVGDRLASMSGTATIMVSMAVLATGATTEWIVVVGAGLVLQGLGQGLCGPSLNAAVAGAVPPEHLGVATAAKNLFNQVVTAFGIALLAGLYAGGTGYRSAFFAGGIMALLALCAATLMKKDRPGAPGGL